MENNVTTWLADLATGGEYTRRQFIAEQRLRDYWAVVNSYESLEEDLRWVSESVSGLESDRRLMADHSVRLYWMCFAERLINAALTRAGDRMAEDLASQDRRYDAKSVEATALRHEVERQRGVIATLRQERDILLLQAEESREVLADVRRKRDELRDDAQLVIKEMVSTAPSDAELLKQAIGERNALREELTRVQASAALSDEIAAELRKEIEVLHEIAAEVRRERDSLQSQLGGLTND